jgi:hypothetical protein
MSQDVTCPFCGRRLSMQYVAAAGNLSAHEPGGGELTCPQCLASFTPPGGVAGWSGRRSAAREVHGDASATHIGLLVFTGLCVTGILLTYLAGRSQREPILEMFSIAVLFAVLDVLVFVQLGLRIWRRPLGPSRDAAQHAGKILGVVFLTIGLAVAVVVFFFAVCFGVLVTM